MKIGVSAFAWTARFQPAHLAILPTLRGMGISVFEIAMFSPADLPVAAVRAACAANGLELTVCAILPVGINPISPEPETRKKSRQHLASCIETAAAMGAKLVAGPVYAPIGYLPGHRPTSDEISWAIEAFQSLTPLLDANEITLAIEPVNRSETFFLRTAKEALAIVGGVYHPRVGVTLDTFHASIEERNVALALGELGPALKHIHLSENDRGILGRGHVDFPGILSVLREIAYQGCLMIEGFGYAPNDTSAPGRLWADVTTSPEDFTKESASYLRGLLKTV